MTICWVCTTACAVYLCSNITCLCRGLWVCWNGRWATHVCRPSAFWQLFLAAIRQPSATSWRDSAPSAFCWYFDLNSSSCCFVSTFNKLLSQSNVCHDIYWTTWFVEAWAMVERQNGRGSFAFGVGHVALSRVLFNVQVVNFIIDLFSLYCFVNTL